MNMAKLTAGLEKLYGPGEGTRICMTILPGILADFRKVLLRAAPGADTAEDYLLEDGKGTVRVTGTRRPDGTFLMDAELIPSGRP